MRTVPFLSSVPSMIYITLLILIPSSAKEGVGCSGMSKERRSETNCTSSAKIYEWLQKKKRIDKPETLFTNGNHQHQEADERANKQKAGKSQPRGTPIEDL
jgi:hypothetical protein